jgi:hypothetical protein
MKAIINGLRYDTESAIEIGNAWHGNRGDFHRWDATLYRTPRAGRYFLAGEGGPLTEFGRGSLGQGGRSAGSRIIPMTVYEAREWAEQNLGTAAIEAHFADEITDA